MSYVSMLKVILGLIFYYFLLVSSKVSSTEQEEDALLSGVEKMNDEDLWNLLKQISRNGSENPLDSFNDYEDFTLVDDTYTSNVSQTTEFYSSESSIQDLSTETLDSNKETDEIDPNELPTQPGLRTEPVTESGSTGTSPTLDGSIENRSITEFTNNNQFLTIITEPTHHSIDNDNITITETTIIDTTSLQSRVSEFNTSKNTKMSNEFKDKVTQSSVTAATSPPDIINIPFDKSTINEPGNQTAYSTVSPYTTPKMSTVNEIADITEFTILSTSNGSIDSTFTPPSTTHNDIKATTTETKVNSQTYKLSDFVDSSTITSFTILTTEETGNNLTTESGLSSLSMSFGSSSSDIIIPSSSSISTTTGKSKSTFTTTLDNIGGSSPSTTAIVADNKSNEIATTADISTTEPTVNEDLTDKPVITTSSNFMMYNANSNTVIQNNTVITTFSVSDGPLTPRSSFNTFSEEIINQNDSNASTEMSPYSLNNISTTGSSISFGVAFNKESEDLTSQMTSSTQSIDVSGVSTTTTKITLSKDGSQDITTEGYSSTTSAEVNNKTTQVTLTPYNLNLPATTTATLSNAVAETFMSSQTSAFKIVSTDTTKHLEGLGTSTIKTGNIEEVTEISEHPTTKFIKSEFDNQIPHHLPTTIGSGIKKEEGKFSIFGTIFNRTLSTTPMSLTPTTVFTTSSTSKISMTKENKSSSTNTILKETSSTISSISSELLSTKSIPFSEGAIINKSTQPYTLSSLKNELVFPTSLKDYEQQSTPTTRSVEIFNKKTNQISTPSSTKTKKIFMDPSKKVYILTEDDSSSKLYLKNNFYNALASTTGLPHSSQSTTASIASKKQSPKTVLISTFSPGLETTPVPLTTKLKAEFVPQRKVIIPPNYELDIRIPIQFFSNKSIEGKGKVQLVKDENIKKPKQEGNVFDSSRIFMIDEATSPTKVTKPFSFPNCCNHFTSKKGDQNKLKENTSPGSLLPTVGTNQFKKHKHTEIYVNEHKKNKYDGVEDLRHKTISSISQVEGAINVATKTKFSFDPKKIYLIGDLTTKSSPTYSISTPKNVKKSKFDLNRKFVIENIDKDTNEKPKEQKHKLSNGKKIEMSRPVIQISPVHYVPLIKDDNHKQVMLPAKQVSKELIKYQIVPVQFNQQYSVPELLCFELKNMQHKPVLSCLPLNSTAGSNVMNFFTKVNSNSQHYGHQQIPPVAIRKVLFKNRNPVSTSVIIKPIPTINKLKYSLSGSVSHTEQENSRGIPNAKVNINIPGTEVMLTDARAQDVIGQSIIALQRSDHQNLLFMGKKSNPLSNQQSYSLQKNIVSRRSKRSTLGNCKMDGVYENEGSSLAFVFDNTGSMAYELNQMRETAIHIATELTEKKKNLIRDYVLVTFNDPDVAEPFCTNDYNEFINALNSITVQGGHDCPELALTGLKSALTVTRPNSFIFVITDADAKDYYEEENIQPLIMRKSPYIFFLMTERCYGWEHQKGFDVFYSISEQTNGQIIMMDKDDVKKNSLLGKVLDSLTADYLQENLAPLKKISSKLPALVPYSVPVPVDQAITKLTFVLTGSQPKLHITDPKGGKPSGDSKEFPKYKSVTFKEPQTGIWKAQVGSSSHHSFSSYGISTNQIKVGFSVLKTNKVSETSHRPLKSAENYVLVEVSNPELVGNISSIDLVNLKGNLLETIHLTRDPTSNKLYSGGPFLPPDESFNLEVNGFSADGSPIKRISSTAILPQLPELPYVILASENSVEEGTSFFIKCHVESLVPTTVKIYKKENTNIQKVYSMKQTGDVEFELKNISLIDQGTYVCWARNVAGEKAKEMKISVIVKPPNVSVKDEVLFVEQNTILIPCIVESRESFRITWRKGSGSRWNDIQSSSLIYNTEKGLIITYPTKFDEGWYQCTASNIGGESSGITFLKLSLPPLIEISGLRRFYSHFNITITCLAISGIPSPELKWRKNGVDLAGDNKRIFVTYLEKYAKIEIVNAIQDDEGSYSCIAVNFAGQDIKDLDLVYEEKPKAVTSIKSCNIIYGGNCTIKCSVSGKPTPSVLWKKDGKIITPSTSANIEIVFDEGLLINNAELSDNGLYSCVAQSAIGYSEDSVVVSVSGYSPKIIEAPVDTIIEIGDSGRLSCVADGIPLPKIKWKKNHEILIQNSLDENFLEINSASLSDGGLYTCAAENIFGVVESQAQVNISGGVPPILSKDKDLDIKKVLIGEKVELPCIVIGGNPLPLKEWYKNGNLLSDQPWTGIKLENGSYFISAVSAFDIGLYECVARNELGTDVKKIQLKLYEPPRIDLNISSIVVATSGKAAKLQCKVSGDPPPKVSWRRHVYSNNKTMRGTHADDTNELIFYNVTEEDSGRYICQAENIAGVARRSFALNVMVPPKIVPWPIEIFVEAGNNVTLECRSRARPRPSIHWLKNNVTIPEHKLFGQFLRFYYAEPSDSGTYSCIAENKAGKDTVETNLIVLVPPKIKDGDTLIKIKAISGSEAILPCDVTGNPQPSVTWYLNGELIKKHIGSEPPTLRLLNVTEADAGTYICYAQNKAGANKKKMELNVLTRPKVLPWTEPMKVVVGDYLNVTCQAFANPEAKISWFKDGKPVPLDFMKNEKNIAFVVEKDHKGNYTCEARNEAGADSKDFLLVILGPPTFAKNQPVSVDVLRGKDIEIPCIAFGDPKPIMSWNRNGILQNNNRRIVNSETGQLTILNADREDDGYYNCTASNRAGLVWRTVEVNVLELPTANLTVSNSFLKEGDEVEFTCNVAGRPRPKVYWEKDNEIVSTEYENKLRFIANYEDRGNYTCIVKNLAGEDYSTIFIDISVLPTIKGNTDERITSLKGGSVVMNCSAEGIPEPEIIWFFNDTILNGINANLVINEETLLLKNIDTENAGVYKCVAKNFAGLAHKTFTLYVHMKPVITDLIDTKIIINEGKDFSVPCNADGIPKPKVSWKKDGRDIVVKNARDTNIAIYENILILLNADNSTEGIYTCAAINMEGKDQRDYIVSVQAHKHEVKEGIKEVEIVEGHNGLMNCDAKPGSEIIWMKDNVTLDKMPLERADDIHFLIGDSGQLLKITEAFSEDAGLYSCFAIHPDGNSTKFFSVNVKYRPYFNDLLFATLQFTVRENESITLHCPAIGSPTPQINWRLAENNLPINVHTVPGVQFVGENDNSLFIKSAKYSHSGLYLCSASNDLGKENRIFNIKVIGPPERIGPDVTNIEIKSGGELELNCSVRGSPDPYFKWTYITPTGEEKTLNFETKYLHIGYVQVEDEGLYSCLASNVVGNATKHFNVSVIETPRIKRGNNNSIILAEGEDLELSCKFEGRKPASVMWFFNGKQLNASNITIQHSYDFTTTEYTCKLLNASKEIEGLYGCLVSNIAGSDEQKYKVTVIVAPKMLSNEWRKLQILQFMVGSDIKIKCPAESVDDFKIQWKKNGQLLPHFENLTLHISSCTIQDEAEYMCIASNIAGKLASKFQVNVLAGPKLINSRNNVTTKVLLDSKLLLNCSVEGNPPPKILWTKNMKPVDNTTHPQIILYNNNQLLEIDEVDTSDSGKYSCYCSNIAGFIENHFDVEVIVPPIVKEGSESMEKIVNTELYRRVVLRCPLLGSPEPSITWYRDTQEIGEGNPSYLISHDKKMLIINHPNELDGGIYKCFGKNDVGDQMFTFVLHLSIILKWSQWSEWSECSVSCGGGLQLKTRQCLGERNEILSEYVHFQNNSCLGSKTESRPCNFLTCPTNGGWGNWTEWSDCSRTCGEGLMRRTRRCNNPLPSNGGEECIGETYEDRICELVPCPVNGNWGEWSDWSKCTATCGYSLKMRTRRCNNPAPAYGGLPCSGHSRDITVCKKRKCEDYPKYIGWSPWSKWSVCSVTCGTGRQYRNRVCLGEFNKSCIGEPRQNKLCFKESCQRRIPRSAELNIYGELNGLPVQETFITEIEENSNETAITVVPKNTENSSSAYLPFITSPVSWLAAHEDDGKNGFSFTNGSFHENTTYLFSTGEEMNMQSDARIEDPSNPLKLYIQVTGKAPVDNKATIVIDPYEENIMQTDRKTIKSASKTVLQANGRSIPVSWRKRIEIPENRNSRIVPVERLKSTKLQPKYNNEKRRIEYHTASSVTSTFEKNSCPDGFQYDDNSGECRDINECVRKMLNKCYQTEICINTIGSYTCECREGYRERSDKEGCKDVNECLEGSHLCSHNCQNVKGSYQCLCPYNMILSEDLLNCVELSEEEYDYSLDRNNKDYYEERLSQLPKPKKNNWKVVKNLLIPNRDDNDRRKMSSARDKEIIACETGFRIRKHECEDINECLEDGYACTTEQLCMNTPGSHVCIDAPCPDKFIYSPETRSCLLLCLDYEADCTDGALLSESLQIITVPVYRTNYTFYPFTEILVLSSYDDNNLPIDNSVYEIVQNEAGLPVKVRSENRVGVLYAANYFEVEKKERLILMSSNYDSNGEKLHSTMFVVLMYNSNADSI